MKVFSKKKFLADPQGATLAQEIPALREILEKADGRKVSESSRLRLGKGDLSIAILPAWCEEREDK